MELGEFQERALQTKQYPLDKPEHASAAAFGLVQATGSIARLFKKHLYKNFDLSSYRDFLRRELGDLLLVHRNCGQSLQSRFGGHRTEETSKSLTVFTRPDRIPSLRFLPLTMALPAVQTPSGFPVVWSSASARPARTAGR